MTKGEILWLGALLHDIGKFWERANDPVANADAGRYPARYSHESFSALFVDTFNHLFPDEPTLNHVRSLVQNHHNPTWADEMKLSVADRLSSEERMEAEDEGGIGKSTTPLCSIFSNLRINEERIENRLYHRLRRLRFDRETIFAQTQVHISEEDYRGLWAEFSSEVRNLRQGDWRTLFALLKKYTSFIPSDTRRDTYPDVSLFDHLRTTAAIACCLEGWPDEEISTLNAALTRIWRGETLSESESKIYNEPLSALVKGDISGTQSFLYLITSAGAARGLRGRSFYLQLLCEVIARWILRRLSIPLTNLLFVGGGHFYLLIPWAEVQSLSQVQEELARKLWSIHRGDLSVNVAHVPVTAADFCKERFAEKWGEVSRAVSRKKLRRWRDLDDETFSKLFEPQETGGTETICQICRFEGRLEEAQTEEGEMVMKCQRCRGFEELGAITRNAGYMVEFEIPEEEIPPDIVDPDWRDSLRAFGVDIQIRGKGAPLPKPAYGALSATIYRFDTTDFISEERFKIPTSYDFKLLADATPVLEEEIARFGEIAEASRGAEWLGVLRMDVDSLGEVFRQGLGEHATISRMSALSEGLRLFFEAHVPRLCREVNESADQGLVYLIYAGGDDLFVVGSWSALPELAMKIRDEFRGYIGGDHITLSGGISVEHAKYPLYQLAENARSALDDEAKEFVRPDGCEKDALCFLSHTADWDTWRSIHSWKDRLVSLISPEKGKPLPRSFLTRLSEVYHAYLLNLSKLREMGSKGEIGMERLQELTRFGRWKWRLVYSLSRFAEQHKEAKETIEELQRDIAGGLIEHTRAIARWAELLTRRKEEGR